VNDFPIESNSNALISKPNDHHSALVEETGEKRSYRTRGQSTEIRR